MLVLGAEQRVAPFRSRHSADKKGGRAEMLVLTRKPNQSIMIGDDIEVSVLSVVGDKVRIGIHAPQDIPVFRTEIYVEIQREEGEGTRDAAVRTEVDEALDRLRDAT
jgi:carbon storage regulator